MFDHLQKMNPGFSGKPNEPEVWPLEKLLNHCMEKYYLICFFGYKEFLDFEQNR